MPLLRNLEEVPQDFLDSLSDVLKTLSADHMEEREGRNGKYHTTGAYSVSIPIKANGVESNAMVTFSATIKPKAAEGSKTLKTLNKAKPEEAEAAVKAWAEKNGYKLDK